MEAWKADLLRLGAFFLFISACAYTGISACVRAMTWPEPAGAGDGEILLNTGPDSTSFQFYSLFTLKGLQSAADLLQQMYDLNPLLSHAAHAIGLLYIQTFAIPGTVFFNLTGGALFGMWLGYPICLFFNSLGASSLFYVSRLFGGNLVKHFFPQRVESMRQVVESKREHSPFNLLLYMISMRVFPFTPNWFINVASAHLQVPNTFVFISCVFGLTPYNFLSCQAGLILKDLTSTRDIFDASITIRLILLAVTFSLLPWLLNHLQGKLPPAIAKPKRKLKLSDKGSR